MTETLNHLTDNEWVAEIKRRRDLAIRALAKATNPLKRRSQRARRDSYEAKLTMGRAAVREANRKRAEHRY
jgi:hypothetical protein